MPRLNNEPAEYTKHLHIRISPEQLQELRDYAQGAGRNIGAVARELLAKGVAQAKAKAKAGK